MLYIGLAKGKHVKIFMSETTRRIKALNLVNSIT